MADSDVDMQAGSLPTASSLLYLKNADLDPLTEELNNASTCMRWSQIIETDNDDDWHEFLVQVSLKLLWLLAKTSLKGKVIAELKYHQAMDMISGFDEEQMNKWKDAIRKGVETDGWADLIQLTKLKNPKMPNVARGVPIELQHAVIRAYGRPYLGDAHEILLRAIDDLDALPVKNNYAKIIPIIQSSGTGKSKTGQAYPLADVQVRKYFRDAPDPSEKVPCKKYLRNFLSSLFILGHRLGPHIIRGDGMLTYEDMAKSFYEYFGNQLKRSEFYEQVIDHAQKDSEANVAQYFERFTAGLKRRCSNWPANCCPILISLDEVHVLNTSREDDIDSNHTLYSVFSSVLHEAVGCHFGVVCMSTASHIGSLVPLKETARSIRERKQEMTLPAPFTELPFDVDIIANPLVPGQETLYSVGSLEFTARFGRPLFYATYESRKTEPGNQLNAAILSIIQGKLSGRPWPPQTEDSAKLDSSSIAVLSARLQLDLYPGTVDARQYEAELVRNHLRMLYSVSPDRQTITTGSPPGPLIAEASAEIMHHTLANGKPYMDFWGLLWRYIDHGLASQAGTGELIGRALSISAMDRAIHSLPSASVCELTYQTPVTVTDYYKALLTDEAWEELRHSNPANRAQLSDAWADKTFEDAFQDGYFHFSHYGQANDISPMQSQHAWAHWLRGTAVACQLDQGLTDRMTPIYFPGPSNLGVSPKTISVNLDQDQTGSVIPSSVSIQSAEALSIFSGTELPYIAAVHCYALTKSQGISVAAEESPQIEKLQSQPSNKEAPRYQIDFRGLSAYAGITDAEKSIIRKMINRSKNGLFASHSRDYGVAALKRMLPVLTNDPASTEWYKGGNEKFTAGPSTVPCSGQERPTPAKRAASTANDTTSTLASASPKKRTKKKND